MWKRRKYLLEEELKGRHCGALKRRLMDRVCGERNLKRLKKTEKP